MQTPPPEPSSLFTPEPVLVTRTGVAETAALWSRLASSQDLDALAVDLLEVAPPPGDAAEADRRLVALTMAGKFERALDCSRVLADEPLPNPHGELGAADLARATSRAARGDDAAFRWLREVAPMLASTNANGFVAHCLLLVADARGDADLAGAALSQLRRIGPTGRRLVPRIAADLLGRRRRAVRQAKDRTAAAKEGAAALVEVIDLLHRASASFVSDPQPVLDTAALLVERGDRSGAVLLLAAVNRTNPQVRRIETSLSELRPRGVVGRRRLRRVAFCVLGLLLYVVGFAAGEPVLPCLWAIVVVLVEIFAREPGLSRIESASYAAYLESRVRPFFRLARSVADEPPVPWPNAGLRLVVLVATPIAVAVLGLLLYPTAVELARVRPDAGQGGWVTSPGLACFLAYVLIPPVALMWVWSLVPRRRLGYVRPTLSDQLVDARCACWDRAVLEGPLAIAYLADHLQPVPTPVPLEPVLARHPDLAPRVWTCPQTGGAWLALALGPEGGSLLLRSPLGSFPDPEPDADDDVPTGAYL